MTRILLALSCLVLVAACGGGSRYSSSNARSSSAPSLYATGPIQKACLAADRRAASRSRCGCIQAVANQQLSPADQRRGAKYFRNPARLQEVRQSDNASNERFWRAWKAYGQSAARVCEGS